MPSYHTLSQIIPGNTALFTEENGHSKGSRPSCSAAIFVLLFVSTFFIIFPFFCDWFSKHVHSESDKGGRKRSWGVMVSSTLKKFTWGARYFGTGVILGSAFIHILPSVQQYLTNPCLPDFWVRGYPAMGNLLVLVAVMVIFLIDLFTKRWMERARWVVMSVEVPVEMLRDNEDTLETAGEMLRNVKFHPAHDAGGSVGTMPPQFRFPSPKRPTQTPRGLHSSCSDIPLTERQPISQSVDQQSDRTLNHFVVPTSAVDQQELCSLLVLEAGIILHSLLVGIALMVVDEVDFHSLFVALIFHQVFEGLALGVRLAALKTSGRVPLWASLVYGLATPIGCGIGMAMRTSLSMHSEKGLIVMGIFDAVSAGLLLYTGMVGLLAKDFLGGMTKTPGRDVGWGLGMFALGVLAMAVLAVWA